MALGKVQKNVLKICANNPNKWISTNDVIEITGCQRPSVNYAMKSLEKKGLLKREKRIREDLRNKKVVYVKLDKEGYKKFKGE